MTKAANNRVSIFAVGDVFVDMEDGASAFRHAKGLLGEADIVVGNCEGVYSDAPAPPPTIRHPMTAPRERAACLGSVPFHVMGCANNHIVDGGYGGLADTLETLRSQGIATTGAGDSVDEAFRPAIVARKAIRVAFLAVASVFPVGYEARSDRPGLAAVRVRTFYSIPDPTFWEPGIPPLITTAPVPEDLDRLGHAIAAARKLADIVFVACHWGNSSRYEVVQDYERQTARLIVDMGADAVLCHHHHSLRGMEFYKGRPVFYGLGAFVHHFAHFNPSSAQLAAARWTYGEYAHGPREGYPLSPVQHDARLTGVATFEIENNAIAGVGFVPAVILPDGSTELCRPGSAPTRQVTDYFRRLTASLGADTAIADASHGEWVSLRLTKGD